MLKKISGMKTKHQIFFAILIAFAVVSFWRGIWGLMDIYLLPENVLLSNWVSVAIGLLILGAIHYITKELM